jgi:PAS domain-containing protein
LIQIRSIDTLPQEERENRFRVVLDNISDGVVSIDREGNVTYQAVAETFGLEYTPIDTLL